MKRILVVEYSQSGDVTKVVDAFTGPLGGTGAEVRAHLQPVVPYPYPWRSIRRLFGVFPECFVPAAEAVCPPAFSPEDRFDLIVLAYQVWHLAPSLPIQAFLRSEHARVLRGSPVITLCVSRKMWHSASETMKRLLLDLGAIHLDNVVVTHQGAPFSTFVSVPRALLYGKRDRLWGVFPPAGLSRSDLARAERLGGAVAARLDEVCPPYHPLLTGQGAVEVKRLYVVPEAMGWYLYRACARVVARRGLPGGWLRQVEIVLFVWLMLGVILLGIPLSLIVILVLYPFLRGSIERYARRLTGPSDGAPPVAEGVGTGPDNSGKMLSSQTDPRQ